MHDQDFKSLHMEGPEMSDSDLCSCSAGSTPIDHCASVVAAEHLSTLPRCAQSQRTLLIIPRRAPRRRPHPSPPRPAPAASSSPAAPSASGLILHRCAPRQRHHPSLLRPAPADLPPASPAANGRQALAAPSCGRHLHRQRPAVHLQRPHPLNLKIFSFYFLLHFFYFIFYFCSHICLV